MPDGVPNNPCEYSYLKILQPSGQHDYIGLPWIDKSSTVVHGESNIRFSIENVTAEDISKINTILSAYGYSAKDWTIEWEKNKNRNVNILNLKYRYKLLQEISYRHLIDWEEITKET